MILLIGAGFADIDRIWCATRGQKRTRGERQTNRAAGLPLFSVQTLAVEVHEDLGVPRLQRLDQRSRDRGSVGLT